MRTGNELITSYYFVLLSSTVRPNEGAGAGLEGAGLGKVDTIKKKPHGDLSGSAVHAHLSAVQLEQDVGCKKAVCDRSPPPPANSPDDLWTVRGGSGSQEIYKLFG